jgi:hypothetical protein
MTLLPDGDEYGVNLEETNGSDTTITVSCAAAGRIRRIRPQVLDAVRESGHARSVLSAHRRAPIPLAEHAGVRLGLVLLSTGPIRKATRIDAIASGVASLSTEEAYYWYAKCMGPDAGRVRRALRLFLAEE